VCARVYVSVCIHIFFPPGSLLHVFLLHVFPFIYLHACHFRITSSRFSKWDSFCSGCSLIYLAALTYQWVWSWQMCMCVWERERQTLFICIGLLRYNWSLFIWFSGGCSFAFLFLVSQIEILCVCECVCACDYFCMSMGLFSNEWVSLLSIYRVFFCLVLFVFVSHFSDCVFLTFCKKNDNFFTKWLSSFINRSLFVFSSPLSHSTYTYIHTHSYTCRHTHKHPQTETHTITSGTWICRHRHPGVYIYVYIYTHVHMSIYTYKYMCIWIYFYICIWPLGLGFADIGTQARTRKVEGVHKHERWRSSSTCDWHL